MILSEFENCFAFPIIAITAGISPYQKGQKQLALLPDNWSQQKLTDNNRILNYCHISAIGDQQRISGRIVYCNTIK